MAVKHVCDIVRVPGGWIYHNHTFAVFVPFNSEFKSVDAEIVPEVEEYVPPAVKLSAEEQEALKNCPF